LLNSTTPLPLLPALASSKGCEGPGDTEVALTWLELLYLLQAPKLDWCLEDTLGDVQVLVGMAGSSWLAEAC